MASDGRPRRSRRPGSPGCLVLLAALACAAPAAAAGPTPADKETARSLMDQGDDRTEARDFAGALKAYQAADAIMHLPMTGAAVARAQESLGLWVEARDTAFAVLRLPVLPGENAAYARARADASALAARLGPRIPALSVQISNRPAGLAITVDGAPVPPAALDAPHKVNPGRHVIAASAPGFAEAHVEVTVTEGAVVPVPLALSPVPSAAPIAEPAPALLPLAPAPVAPSPPAPPAAGQLSPLVYAGFITGGAALVAAGITGGLSLARTSSLFDDGCNPVTKRCPPAANGDLQAANLLANVSNVTLGVGIAGVALGVVGVVISPRVAQPGASGLTLSPVIGPGVAGVRGTF
jgi:hypothetical protein